MFTDGLDKSALRWVREVSFYFNPYYFAFKLILLSNCSCSSFFTLLSFGVGISAIS